MSGAETPGKWPACWIPYRAKGKLQEGVPLPNGGILRVDISQPNGHLPAALSHMKIDNNIIGIALALKEKRRERRSSSLGDINVQYQSRRAGGGFGGL